MVSREIEYNLYFARVPVTNIVYQLVGLVHMLDEHSKEELKDILKTLERFDKNVKLISSRMEMFKLYSKIMDYLHRTYLRECRYAKPKYGKTKLGVPDRK